MAEINLKEYLKNVAELESSIYNQKEILENSEAVFKKNKPTKQTVKKKTVKYPEKPGPSQMEAFITGEERKKMRFLSILSVGGPLLATVILFIIAFVDDSFMCGILAFVCLVLTFVLPLCIMPGVVFKISKNSRERAMEEYEKQYKEADEKNKIFENEYREKQKTVSCEFDARMTIYDKNSHETMAGLKSNLKETERLLKAYYDKGVIFEKYRNLVAMTTMYEYFASGRCAELEGPNGAYNLYEQETRQNIIITNLQDINQHLSDIKNNQFVLYQAMNEGLQSLAKVQNDISDMARCVKNIETSSAVSAYFAEVTAMNGIYQNSIMTF